METVKIENGLPYVESLRWVVKALSREESRYALNYLRVENGLVMATDGHRLHCWDARNDGCEETLALDGMGNGYYKLIQDKKGGKGYLLFEKEYKRLLKGEGKRVQGL